MFLNHVLWQRSANNRDLITKFTILPKLRFIEDMSRVDIVAHVSHIWSLDGSFNADLLQGLSVLHFLV